MTTEQPTLYQLDSERLNGDDVTNQLIENVLATIGEQLAALPDLPQQRHLRNNISRLVGSKYDNYMLDGLRNGTYLQSVEAMHRLTGTVEARTVNYLRAATWEAIDRGLPIRELYIRLALDTMSVGRGPVSQLSELTGSYTENTCDYLDLLLESIPKSLEVDSSAIDFASSFVKNAVKNVRQHLHSMTDADMGYIINAANSGNISAEASRLLHAKARTPKYKVWVSPFRRLEVETFYEQLLDQTIQLAHEQYSRGDYSIARQSAGQALALKPENSDLINDMQNIIIYSTPDDEINSLGKEHLVDAIHLDQKGNLNEAYALLSKSKKLPLNYLLAQVRDMVFDRVESTLAQKYYLEALFHFAYFRWEEGQTACALAKKYGHDRKLVNELQSDMSTFEIALTSLTRNNNINGARRVWTTAVKEKKWPAVIAEFKAAIDEQWSQEINELLVNMGDMGDILEKHNHIEDYRGFVEKPTDAALVWSDVLTFASRPEKLTLEETIVRQTKNDEIAAAYAGVSVLEENKKFTNAGIMLRIVNTRATALITEAFSRNDIDQVRYYLKLLASTPSGRTEALRLRKTLHLEETR